MVRNPNQAADLLADLPVLLAQGLRDDNEALMAQPNPDTAIVVERRARARGAIARSALSVLKFEDHINRPRRPQDEDDMDDLDPPDDPETLERKYLELQNGLDRLAAEAVSGAAEGGGSAARTECGQGQLAVAEESGPERAAA
ncbi:MAG: hypothetical protein Q8L66_15315 [Caulobacter sp.]|nr:hypothetical protein [Caulobacter sp.]